MPHLSGRCYCGRVKHYPKGARPGTRWECWHCGTVWTILPRGRRGQRLTSKKSLPPPEDVGTVSPPRPSAAPARLPAATAVSVRPGCGLVLLAVVAAPVVWFLV